MPTHTPLLLVSAWAAAVPASASACSFIPPVRPWGSPVDAPVVFVGTAESATPSGAPMYVDATVRVETTLKGSVAATVDVRSGGPCASALSAGNRYLVYALGTSSPAGAGSPATLVSLPDTVNLGDAPPPPDALFLRPPGFDYAHSDMTYRRLVTLPGRPAWWSRAWTATRITRRGAVVTLSAGGTWIRTEPRRGAVPVGLRRSASGVRYRMKGGRYVAYPAGQRVTVGGRLFTPQWAMRLVDGLAPARARR